MIRKDIVRESIRREAARRAATIARHAAFAARLEPRRTQQTRTPPVVAGSKLLLRRGGALMEIRAFL